GCLCAAVCGLAAGPVSAPVYLSARFSLLQRAPLAAAAVAVTAPQQVPAAMGPQGPHGQPTLAPPSAAGPAPGAPVISQVRVPSRFKPQLLSFLSPPLSLSLLHSVVLSLSLSLSLSFLPGSSETHTLTHTHTHSYAHSCQKAVSYTQTHGLTQLGTVLRTHTHTHSDTLLATPVCMQLGMGRAFPVGATFKFLNTHTHTSTHTYCDSMTWPHLNLLVLFVVPQEMQENVKKCKNFLATLIKLASHNSPSPETSRNVKALVQDLLDAKIEPEEFTNRLQSELKSSPQPYLVPFLKKSLPALRLSLLNSQQSLTQPVQPAKTSITPTGAVAGTAATGNAIRQPNSTTVLPQVGASGSRSLSLSLSLSLFFQEKIPCSLDHSFTIPARDDDDINDVASMAGVNLNEESARILATNSELVGTQIRSCKDEAFLPTGLLHRRILETAKKYGVTEVPLEAVNFISHATQSRLRTVLEKVTSIAQHRMDSNKDEEWYEQSSDVRSQLKFFEQLERLEKQRKDEQEREILLKAAKSRSRQEDPEQARLKQKAKEMQQQELAQMRQRDANLTALAAIGPRKKRKVSGSSAGSPASSSTVSTSSRQYPRQRITRVNLRDFIFYMEQERETNRSLLLYRALLK
uniref:TAFH domain-containing protein n=1 Tax=Astyanax mexicanus TaxID=7994 RepID=A0A8B9KK75_ASTMX